MTCSRWSGGIERKSRTAVVTMRWRSGGKLPHLAKNLPRLLFLRGRQVLPGLHAVQHALLLLWRQAGEMLQPLPQQLLPRRRQTPKPRIILQGAFLFGWRQVFVAPQPVPRMTLHPRTRQPWPERRPWPRPHPRRLVFMLVVAESAQASHVPEPREKARCAPEKPAYRKPEGAPDWGQAWRQLWPNRRPPAIPSSIVPASCFSRPVSHFAVTRLSSHFFSALTSPGQTLPRPTAARIFYGFAATSCCTARSSSISKSEYRS